MGCCMHFTHVIQLLDLNCVVLMNNMDGVTLVLICSRHIIL